MTKAKTIPEAKFATAESEPQWMIDGRKFAEALAKNRIMIAETQLRLALREVQKNG